MLLILFRATHTGGTAGGTAGAIERVRAGVDAADRGIGCHARRTGRRVGYCDLGVHRACLCFVCGKYICVEYIDLPTAPRQAYTPGDCDTLEER